MASTDFIRGTSTTIEEDPPFTAAPVVVTQKRWDELEEDPLVHVFIAPTSDTQKVGEHMGEEDHDNYDSEEVDHDSGECEFSAECAICCENGDCTSQSEFGNQGQYHTGEGTYVPCNVCEKHFRGAVQPVAKCERLGVPGYPGFFDCNGAFLQSISVEKLIESGVWVPHPKKVDSPPI